MRRREDANIFSLTWLLCTGLLAGIMGSRMEQAAEEVKGVVINSLANGLSIAESAQLGARTALKGADSAAIQLAESLAVTTQDPMTSALGASGYTALGSKVNTAGAIGLGVFCGIGALYLMKSAKKAMESKLPNELPKFTQTKQVLKYINWGVTSLSSIAGVIGYRALALNSFELPYFMLCLGTAYGVGQVMQDAFLYSIFSDPEIKTTRRHTKILYERNQELIEQIRQHMQNSAREEKLPYYEPKADTPDEIICPITMMIIHDPIIAADGHAYERGALQEWYNRGGNTCPLNPATVLRNPSTLSTDKALQAKIETYVSSFYVQSTYQASRFGM